MKKNFYLLIGLLFFILTCQNREGEYVCKPCNQSCDELSFAAAGTCPHCGMDLILKSGLEKTNTLLALNQIKIEEGSGQFLIEGGEGHENDSITVFYHKPKNYQPDAKILIVIPGAGRNGDSYRDAWIEESEQYGVLILSPMYKEKSYPFEEYHLCGLIQNLNLRQSARPIENTNQVFLDEEKVTFDLNMKAETWLFNDFDRIFEVVAKELKSTRQSYDLFGHSAGGQILHRMAIFQKNSKSDRILASNSGFYTLPDLEIVLPFGAKNTPLTKEGLKKAFAKKLVLYLGELDNESETGGTRLRSKTADQQGIGRLARGKYFYEFAKTKAEEMNTDFNWQLEIIPGVGHNHRGMGDAAGIYLYGDIKSKE